PTGRPSAPSGWGRDSGCQSRKGSWKRTAEGSGPRASRAPGRSSISRCRGATGRRSRGRPPSSRSRRNLQRVADAQLREEADQPPPFFVGSLVDGAEPLHLVRVLAACDGEADRGLFGEEDVAAPPGAVLEAERE